MAGYGYSYRGYAAYGVPQTEEWSVTSYTSDHVCRPVIIDAEGRKRPIISYTPSQNSESYATNAEKIVPHVHSPVTPEYKYGGQMASDPVEDYRADDNERRGKVEPRWKEPTGTDHDKGIEEFLNKVQIEASRPRFGPVNAANWRQIPTNTVSQGSAGGYGDKSNKGWQTPDGNYQKNGGTVDPAMIPNDGRTRPSRGTRARTPDAFLSEPTNNINTAMRILQEAATPPATAAPKSQYTEPAVIPSVARTRPSLGMWTTRPDASLSMPTSDINTEMRILQETAKSPPPAAPKSQYIEPPYTPTINSRESESRYGKFNFGQGQYAAEDDYKRTIDSREAARRYGGTTV